MDYPFQWDIIVEILKVILVLVQNDGWHEVFTIRLGKTSDVHHNGDSSPVCNLRIHLPWKNL